MVVMVVMVAMAEAAVVGAVIDTSPRRQDGTNESRKEAF